MFGLVVGGFVLKERIKGLLGTGDKQPRVQRDIYNYLRYTGSITRIQINISQGNDVTHSGTVDGSIHL